MNMLHIHIYAYVYEYVYVHTYIYRDEDGAKEGKGRDEGEHERVVQREPEHFLDVSTLDRHADRIISPDQKKQGHGSL